MSDVQKEATLRAIVMGVGFGALFGAANAYLGLRVGMTVSTSIPVAVMTVAALRAFGARASLLEANLSQTTGSASSSLAAGAIFTLPALYMWGAPPSFLQVALLTMLGGILGVCAMVPLRKILIVRAHAELPFPEGRACAEVLRATDGSGGGNARWIFYGLLLGMGLKLAIGLLRLTPDGAAFEIPELPNGELGVEVTAALVGVGFILGYRPAAVVLSGGLVSALLLVPVVTIYLADAAGAEPALSVVKRDHVRLIGIGAVACAGIVMVLRLVPSMASSLLAVIRALRARDARAPVPDADARADRDLPGWALAAGVIVVVATCALVPGLLAGDLPLGRRLVLGAGIGVLGVVFVAVAARIVGIVGVSSQPTSGITLITLLTIGGIFTTLGWGGGTAQLAVLTVGTVVATAASCAGDMSQDLKTGYLLGATPRAQQLGQLVGVVTACWVVAATLLFIGETAVWGEDPKAPQATMMKTVIEGQLSGELPWGLVIAGAGLALAAMLAGLHGLTFAIGVYLPLETLIAIFIGGCVRRLVDGWSKPEVADRGAGAGILAASGLVAGEGLAGVVIAGLVGGKVWTLAEEPLLGDGLAGELGGLAIVAGVAFFLWRAAKAR